MFDLQRKIGVKKPPLGGKVLNFGVLINLLIHNSQVSLKAQTRFVLTMRTIQSNIYLSH